MTEAYHLLNKSIIRVEQPDIILDDDIDDAAPLGGDPAVGEYDVAFFSN